MSNDATSGLPLCEKRIAQIVVGEYATFSRRLDADLVSAFADLVANQNPRHIGGAKAGDAASSGEPVVHEMLLAAHLATVMEMLLPGRYGLLRSCDTEYLLPVFVGDEVTFSVRVEQVEQARSRVALRCLVLRRHEVCCRGNAWVEVRDGTD